MPHRLRRAALVAVILTIALPASAQAASRTLYALTNNLFPVVHAVDAYTVGADDGLTPLGQVSTGADGPVDIALSPDGAYAFVAFESADPSGGVLTYPVAADGSLGPPSRLLAGSSSGSVAVSPDGRFLYLGDDVQNVVRTFAIGAGGALTPVGAAAPSGWSLGDVIVGEDGRHVYASNLDASTIATFQVQADGSLGARTLTPTASAWPGQLTLVPHWNRLLAQDPSWNEMAAFDIAADGSLSGITVLQTGSIGSVGGPVAGGPSPYQDYSFAVGNGAGSTTLKVLRPASTIFEVDSVTLADRISSLAVSADAATLYARATSTNTIRRFAIDDAGHASEVGPGVSVPVTNPDRAAIVLTPEQPPRAAFTVTQAERAVTVDATATTDPEGEAVRLGWDFGDGTPVLVDGDTITSHTYAADGAYEITLVAMDAQDCSTQRTFTGSTVSCNGGAAAEATRTVTFAPPFVPPAPAPPAPAAPLTPPVPPVPPAAPAPRVLPAIEGRGLGPARATRKGRVTLPELTAVCTAGAGPCDDNDVAINATIHGKRVTLGKATFRLADGASRRIRLRLSKPGRRLLRAERSLDVEAIVHLRNAATAAEASREVGFTLLAPRHRRSR
jgi:6-phosphogluconolactonase (cycloisomerase 2 family)